MSAGVSVAVVGLGFGADFVPIYASHPDVDRVVLVEPDQVRRMEVARRFGMNAAGATFEQVLADPGIEAVHVLTPVASHADLAVAAIEAGKHVACAVPMATTLADLDRVIAARRAGRRSYLMMETAVFGREFHAVASMHRRGALGEPTLYRGFHIQNLDGYPRYWQGYPPMHYLTHALSPLLALLGTGVASVSCRGAGRLTPERRTGGYDNPYPAEVGLFTLQDSDVLADITMAFSQTARSYIEGFALYGDRGGVEWPSENSGPLTVYAMGPPAIGSRGNSVGVSALEPPDVTEGLPAPLRRFVRPCVVDLPGMPTPVHIGAHHGGSHPHLVHEFISAIVEQRESVIDAERAASWTAPGICAHESALAGGATVEVPARFSPQVELAQRPPWPR